MRMIFLLVLIAVVILTIVVGAFKLIRRMDLKYERELHEFELEAEERRLKIENERSRYAHEEERRWDKRLKGDA